MIILVGFIISFLLTVILMPCVIWIGKRLEIFDYPNERKVHTHEVVRTGGIALTFGIIIPMILLFRVKYVNLSIVTAFFFLIAVNLLDDVYGLGYKIKFFVQIFCAYLVVSYGGVKIASLGEVIGSDNISLGAFCVPVTVFYIVLVTNSINFADGLDGLVGGLCLFIFSAIGLMAYQGENTFLTVLCAIIVGSLFGFLKYNTFPAIVFLGDLGSVTLGFLAAIATIMLTQNNSIYSPAISLLILGFPMLDAFFVILERIKEKRSIFMPDKNHFHHKLLMVGFSHYSAVIIIYSLQAVFIGSAFVFRYSTSSFIFLGYTFFTAAMLSLILLTKRVNLIGKLPEWFVNLYYLLQQKIRKRIINRYCITGILILVIVFYAASLYLIQNASNMFSYYLVLYIILILFLIVKEKLAYLLQVNRLAVYFIGSYFIYSIEYEKAVNIFFSTRIWSNYFFILLGLLFMISNFSDLEKSYYNPVMYIVCFISAIAFLLFYDFASYQHITLIFIKIVVLSVSVDLLIDTFKPNYKLITAGTITAWSVLVLKSIM